MVKPLTKLVVIIFFLAFVLVLGAQAAENHALYFPTVLFGAKAQAPMPPEGDYPPGYGCQVLAWDYSPEWYVMIVNMACTKGARYGESAGLLYVTGLPPEQNNGIDISWFWWDYTLDKSE